MDSDTPTIPAPPLKTLSPLEIESQVSDTFRFANPLKDEDLGALEAVVECRTLLTKLEISQTELERAREAGRSRLMHPRTDWADEYSVQMTGDPNAVPDESGAV